MKMCENPKLNKRQGKAGWWDGDKQTSHIENAILKQLVVCINMLELGDKWDKTKVRYLEIIDSFIDTWFKG